MCYEPDRSMATTLTDGTIHVFTYKEGLLSRLAHDLRLTVTRWQIVIDGRDVRGTFDARSLVVDGVVRGPRVDQKTLAQKDLADIAGNIEQHVLKTARYPEITYEGRVAGVREGKVTLKGTLTLVGRTGPLDLVLERRGDKVVGAATLLQTRWGITPFSAALGAIKIKNDVDVKVELPVPRLEAEAI